ncbi:MAG: hypothetical protein HRU30_20085 [Rhodobacteraceae bacterium]|nr:hypothetical protein [Paracoccaceae bacterium]
MQLARPVGQGASARKYDILTALGAYALSQDKHEQRRVLRLITLVTARYNWARDLLAVGQREIAALWSVDERTVKREMAQLRARGWLVIKRPGARGRVTEYGVDLAQLLKDTSAQWANVGSDFVVRMGQGDHPPDNIVALPVKDVAAPSVADGSEWALAAALVHSEDPGLFASWVAGLTRVERVGGRVTVQAPSRFHAAYVQTHLERRLLAACREVDPEVTELRVIV